LADNSVRPQSWRNWFYLAAFTLALLAGGGGAEGPLQNGIIAAVGAVLLLALAADQLGGSDPHPRDLRAPALIAVSLILIPILQLIPLPPRIWHALPGRENAVQALGYVGHADSWRPLSLDPEATRRWATMVLWPVAIFLYVLRSRRDHHLALLRLVVVCAALSGFAGLLQLALGHPLWLSFYEGPSIGAASGFFANPNHQALFMIAGMVATAIIIRTVAPHPQRSSWMPPAAQMIGWIILFFFALMTLATGSRAGLLLLCVGLPGSLLIAIGSRSLSRLAVGLVGVLALLWLIAILYPGTNTLAIRESLSFGEDVRYAYLPDILYTLQQYWPAGSGLGTFVQVFSPNENLDLARQAYLNHAHNDLLEWLTETGAVGLVWMGLAMLAVPYFAYRQIRAGRGDPAMLLGAILFTALAVLHSLFDYPLRTAALASVTALFLGLIATDGSATRETAVGHARRGWQTAVAMLIALPITAETLRLSLVQWSIRYGHDAAALRLGPSNADVLVQRSAAAAKTNDPALAERLAAQAVVNQPMNVAALRSLAMAREAQGKPAGSQWRLASSLGWRDQATQFWAFRQALVEGEAGTAAIRADALLRTGQPPAAFTGLLRAAARNPSFAEAIAGRLRFNPNWRAQYFKLPVNPSPPEIAGVLATLEQQSRNPDSQSRADGRSLIAHLIKTKAFDQAVQVDRLVAGERVHSGNWLDDGSFDRPADEYVTDSTPFDWQIHKGRGTTGSIEPAPPSVLIAETDGEKAGIVANRYVRLPPGSYRLTYRVRSDAPDAFRVRMACANAVGTLAQDQPSRSSDFSPRSVEMTVPAGCQLARLFIENLPTGASTTAEFDSFQLTAQ